MSVLDYSLVLHSSHSNESTILCVVCRAGCGNRLCLFLIIPFSSTVHVLMNLQFCVWCVWQGMGIDCACS